MILPCSGFLELPSPSETPSPDGRHLLCYNLGPELESCPKILTPLVESRRLATAPRRRFCPEVLPSGRGGQDCHHPDSGGRQAPGRGQVGSQEPEEVRQQPGALEPRLPDLLRKGSVRAGPGGCLRPAGIGLSSA